MSADLLMLPPQDEVARLWAPRLAKEVPGVNVIVAADEDEASAVLKNGVRAAYGTLTPRLIEAATGLEWLQAPMAAPPAGYYFPELTAHPVVVTNMRDTYTDHVSTHAVALLLSLARNLPYYLRKQIDRSWAPDKREETILHLPEATVLIVGLGALGEYIARLLRPLGCRIVGTDARREEKPDPVDEMGRPEDLDAYLTEADAVLLTVPHTPETYKLIDERRLGLMKPSALLVNIGRGAVVDIDALATALRDGVIRAAAIDVVPEEPLPADHPLWSEPRAIVTPHVAAVGPHKEERRFTVLRENAERFLSGRDLFNVVDKAAWF
ncbi:D-2-hydroxyacid dehydrogenase [Amycolatopsis pigmentata]|uniref:D-2-hydroxyacid dehydrogenase n=1 Tax=Amycolatopsis pigmentata TaxID=450801 RepID=A0ABW5FRM0_9PSEU